MNFKETTRHEVLGHAAAMRAVTTAAIVICPELPPGGLQQSMHNPSIPLNVHDFFTAPSITGNDNGVGVAITSSLISDAVQRVHTSGVNNVFKDQEDLFPRMPVLHCIRGVKTKFWQFGGIFEDEGTISGTYGVHRNIFIEQLGLQAPEELNTDNEDDFTNRLWLVHGDQLTAQRIRSVKAEQMRAARPFDRRDWMIGLPAWFHIQMNLLNTIVRTHWASTQANDHAHHTLKADSVAWGRSQYSRDNAKYHLLQPIVAQGFTARVVALFYAALRRSGHLPLNESVSLENPENVDKLISRLTTSQFLQAVEDVRLAAFTLYAWDGSKADGQPHGDTEFRTMCRMLQEVELFLTVRHAVKHADIGMLRRLVDPLAVVFFGAAQHNYGREMLFYRWHLSAVNSLELQHAILASGLVNWPGRSTTHKPIDLGLEHLNCSCKIEMKCYKNSTYDTDTVFDQVCLCNTWVRELRDKLEGSFGTYMPGNHTIASAVLDMFSLARSLFTSDLAEPRRLDELTGSFFDSEDIFKAGMSILANRVETFNQRHAQRADGLRPSYLSTDASGAADDFINIDEYADNVDETADGVVDPTIDLSCIV